jgi:hypothetical protein
VAVIPLKQYGDNYRGRLTITVAPKTVTPKDLPTSKSTVVDSAKLYLLEVDDSSKNIAALLKRVGQANKINLDMKMYPQKPNLARATGTLWSLENGGVGNRMIKKFVGNY